MVSAVLMESVMSDKTQNSALDPDSPEMLDSLEIGTIRGTEILIACIRDNHYI